MSMIKKVEVTRVKAAGVSVRLDGEEAWLPGHELSTQFVPSRALFEQNLCAVGDELEVIEYGTELGGKRKLVSCIRVHDDPWEKVNQWKTGDVKEMEVHSVTQALVFGYIEPGIEGCIVLEELYDNARLRFPPTWQDFKFISAGDIVAGYVDASQIDHERRLVKLDIASYIKNLRHIPEVLPVGSTQTETMTIVRKNENYRMGGGLLMAEIRRILLVDDSEAFLGEVGAYLENCGIKVSKAVSKDEGMAFINNPDCPDIDIALIDIHLSGGKTDFAGFILARRIEKLQPHCRIILATGDEQGIDDILKSNGELSISYFLNKPFGLKELSHALSVTIREAPKKLKDFFKQNRNEENHYPAPPDNDGVHPLYVTLDDLRKEIGAETVILFSIHPVSRNVSVVEECGRNNEKLDDFMLKLRYSPVSDVAIRGESILENRIKLSLIYPKHRWLHRALRYESCIACPVAGADERKYALFAFHRYAERFSEKEAAHVKITAKEIARVFQIKRLQETLKSESPYILAGKTYGSMAHDLIEALSREFRILNMLDTLKDTASLNKEKVDKVKKDLEFLLHEFRRARGIVKTFRRMSGSHLEAEGEVDVFEVVTAVAKYMEIEAEKLNTKVCVAPLQKGGARAIKIRRTSFEQVLYNLILNAAQQIDRFAFVRAPGVVQIEIEQLDDEEGRRLRILLHDSGPGIHTYSFERIFQKGYSTKENGCGMGLDICRSILTQAKGKIRVLKSVLFAGTTFEILLPV